MARRNSISIGQEFGKLTVLSRAENRGHHPVWNCTCACGNTIAVFATNLQRGLSVSCGCAWKSQGGESMTREYYIWEKMLDRCYKPEHINYRFYGGLGHFVCQRWRESVAAFIEDMGRAPTAGHSIDRVDPNGNYTCGKCDECKHHQRTANCRWATKREQDRNRKFHVRVTHDGKTMLLKEWAESGMSAVGYHALYSRILRGWDFADALRLPPNSRRPTSEQRSSA